ncbi:MAG: bacteriophage abortive infection AbiH family protein [Streptococcaceae bacterium]|jgi:hypothetical protein|nr:bacteriophage abortive infection AbiH family protein [Streptococcaceae bacterium]
MNLWIIGNGFDIAHGLKTGYYDFAEFLYNRFIGKESDYSDFKKDILENLEQRNLNTFDLQTTGKDGCGVSDSDSALFILKIIQDHSTDDSWNDFENSLGCLRYSEFSDNDIPEFIDKDEDKDPWKSSRTNEDASEKWIEVFKNVKRYFAEWASQISLDEIYEKKVIRDKFDESENLFLSFNYTKTLEEIYSIDEVIHIHGTIDKKDSIIFGHGRVLSEDESENENLIGAEYNLSEIVRITRKELQLKRLNELNLDDITNVYVFGFSFGDVDMPYIEKLASHQNIKEARWSIQNGADFVTKNLPKIKKLGVKNFNNGIR